MRVDYQQKLDEFFNYEVPEYVIKAGKSFITIRVIHLGGELDLKVHVVDVMRYYALEASNISSGCRMLAGHADDWRGIDNLAKMCIAWFRHVNIEELRREARKWDMELKA